MEYGSIMVATAGPGLGPFSEGQWGWWCQGGHRVQSWAEVHTAPFQPLPHLDDLSPFSVWSLELSLMRAVFAPFCRSGN